MPTTQPYDDTALLMTRQPETATAPADDDDDGWSECVLSGYVKRSILNHVGFPSRIQKPVTELYEIRDTEHAGKSGFATGRIGVGDLIVAERPLLVTPVDIRVSGRVEESWTAEEKTKVVSRVAVVRMGGFSPLTRTYCDRLEPGGRKS